MPSANPNPPTINREQRRALAKAARPVHTRARKPRPVTHNTLQVARNNATRLTAAERQRVLLPAHEGLAAMLQGVGTELHWCALQSAITVALAINAQGIARVHGDHLPAAQRALNAIWRRATEPTGTYTRTPLYFDEIDALREALFLHDWQLQNLAASEFHQAVNTAVNQTLGQGGRAIPAPANSLPISQQEALPWQ